MRGNGLATASGAGLFRAKKSQSTHQTLTETERSSLLNNKTERHSTASADTAETKPTITRRIGQTTFKINIHFSKTSRETMNDKIIRMIKNETAGKAVGQ
jgi:hypothetical protein